MELSDYLTIWNKLSESEQRVLTDSTFIKKIPAGTIIHDGSSDCMGVIIVCTGQLRAYILSDEGREITVYRLFERDICLFSASCIMKNIQFDITISAEKDTDVLVIPLDVYKEIMEKSVILANYTNEIMSTRFTDVMWLLEQILWKSLDERLASFLLEESSIDGMDALKITHEQIASHLGTAREVVTRMLKYFQNERLVRLSRGEITITDKVGLNKLIK